MCTWIEEILESEKPYARSTKRPNLDYYDRRRDPDGQYEGRYGKWFDDQ